MIRNLLLLIVIAAPAVFSADVGAATFDLRDWWDANNTPAVTQTVSRQWTFHYNDRNGSLLSSNGSYYQGAEASNLPYAGALVSVGDGGVVDSGLDGIFIHPGYSNSVAIVFRPDAPTLFGSVRVLTDMKDNGHQSTGIGVTVRYTLDGTTTQIGPRYTFTHTSTSPDPLDVLHQLLDAVVLDAGDTVEIIFDNNGSALYDHGVGQIVINEIAANTTPAPTALPAGMLIIGAAALRHRRRRLH